MSSIVTANDLRSGAVVYLASDGRWVGSLAAAAVASDQASLMQLEEQARAAVARTVVTSVYAFDVRVVAGAAEPLSVRERIRASRAPSV